MVYLFRSTTIASISGYILLAAVFVLGFMDFIPFWLELLLIILSFVLEIASIFLALKKYSDILDLANTDLDRFLEENAKLSARAKKQMKMTVDGNEIVILLQHEKTEEVQKRLTEYAMNVAPQDIISKFQYISFLMDLDVMRKDYSRMDQYINEKKMYLRQIYGMNSPAITGTMKKHLSISCDMSVLEAEFYSRTVDLLRGPDRKIAMDYLSVINLVEASVKEMHVMKKYMITSLQYEKGVIYAVLGDEKRAVECMQRVSETNFTYPKITRAKNYLAEKNASQLLYRG